MQDFSKIKVSDSTRKLVDQIKGLDGDKKKIDSRREYDMLKNALAGICDKNDRSYIENELWNYSEPPMPQEPKETPIPPKKKSKPVPPKKSEKPGKLPDEPTKPKPTDPLPDNKPQPKVIPVPEPTPASVRNTQRNNDIDGNNNITINGNGNSIVINKGDGVENSGASGSSSTSSSRPLTPAETKKARENGEAAADLLVGYTTDGEQLQVKALLAEVDKRNVIEFLRGYTDNKGMGDNFFTQMRTENGFKAKQNLMHIMAQHLQGYLIDKYGAESKVAKEVAVILLESEFTSKETESLDKAVTDELKK